MCSTLVARCCGFPSGYRSRRSRRITRTSMPTRRRAVIATPVAIALDQPATSIHMQSPPSVVHPPTTSSVSSEPSLLSPSGSRATRLCHAQIARTTSPPVQFVHAGSRAVVRELVRAAGSLRRCSPSAVSPRRTASSSDIPDADWCWNTRCTDSMHAQLEPDAVPTDRRDLAACHHSDARRVSDSAALNERRGTACDTSARRCTCRSHPRAALGRLEALLART